MSEGRGRTILDASALLAYLGEEIGSEVVNDAIAEGCVISTVNLAEVLSTLSARGRDSAQITADLTERGLLGLAIVVESFILEDAIEAARLRPPMRSHGLSLTDRSCLALARRLEGPVLTADRAWDQLEVGIQVQLIRSPSD